MILSDREIRAALARGAVRITPDPRALPSAWSSTAIDLTLDGQLAFWTRRGTAGDGPVFAPSDPDYNYAELVEQYSETRSIPDEGFRVEPGTFFLGWTIERIQLPYRSRIAARVEGKSSLARLGLGVHVTAPTIHAGFGYNERDPGSLGNPIQLEIWNAGPMTILVEKGMKICQIIFEEVHGTPEQGYAGMFTIQGPRAPGVD